MTDAKSYEPTPEDGIEYRTFLAERIENAYSNLGTMQTRIRDLKNKIADHEATAKVDNKEDWKEAKNDNVRGMLLNFFLSDNEEYHQDRKDLRAAEETTAYAELEIKRLTLLVQNARH